MIPGGMGAVAQAADTARVVRVSVGKREFSESLTMILGQILPGCWSWRWRVVG